MKPQLPPVPEGRHPYKVFVSSTYLDNQERRKLVQDAITMAGMVWHGMEIFTASTRPMAEECLRYAGEADPGDERRVSQNHHMNRLPKR